MKRIACAGHPKVDALQQCSMCQRTWCDACIARTKLGARTFTACPRCRQPLKPIDASTAAASVREAPGLAELLARPFRLEPLLTALAIALPVWLSWIPVIGRPLGLLGFAAAVSYYFVVIDHVGRGRSGMPEPTEGISEAGDIYRLCIRGVLCMLVGTAPFLIWYWGYAPHEDMSAGLFWLLVGQAYMPAALLAVVITQSTAGALWPVAWIQIISRAPVAYVMLVGAYFVSVIVAWYGSIFLHATLEHIPVVGGLMALTIERVLWFVQAALVGGFLAQNAEKLGWD